MTALPLRPLFVGGPGRSGTSFVADRLGHHPEVASLREVELKIFCERGGLLDLHEVLTRSYSPNRAIIALQHFHRATDALIAGRWGQRGFDGSPVAERLTTAFADFRSTLLTEEFPAPLEESAFFDAARGLLARLAEIAASEREQEASCGELGMFLEKTPHNLLFIDFLARLAPGSAFIHVMRDPRSIAWSLLAMRWGPDRITGAAEWVAGYCHAWLAAERRAAELGLTVLRLHIEDLSAAPAPHADLVCGYLGLTPAPQLFDGADPQTLSRWRAKAGADDVALLQERLGGWAAHFGYDSEDIGCRRDGPSATGPAREAVAEVAEG